MLDHGNLTIEYRSHDSDTLDVTVRAANGRFAASASPMLELGALSSLAKVLGDFPDASPIECRLGLTDLDRVILTFFEIGRARHAAVRVQVSSPRWVGPDDESLQESADFVLRTDQAVIDRARKQLRRLERRKSGIVMLAGVDPTQAADS